MTPKALSRITANMSSYEYQKIKQCRYGTNGKFILLPKDKVYLGISLLIVAIIGMVLCWFLFN